MSWAPWPLWALYRRADESGCPDLPLLSVYRDHGVVPREGREDNFNKPGDDLSKYKVVRPGDLVLNKMKTWQGSLGVSRHTGIVSPAYLVGRRIGDVDDRFMHHLLRSRPLVAEYGARSKGIRPAQWDLPWGEFASIKVRIPPAAEQRAIADFLDVETTRVDALIAKKRRLIELLEERWRAGIVAAVSPAPPQEAGPALRRAVDSPVGGSWGAEPGEGDVDAACVRGADFDRRGLTVDVAGAPLRSFGGIEFRRRQLRPGDLIIEKSGGGEAHPVGRVVQWTELGNAVPTNFAARVRPAASADSRYLTYVFRSAYERGITRAWIRQTTGIQNLDLGGLLSQRWRLPGRAEQERVAGRLDGACDRIRRLEDRLHQQVALLREHRKALIAGAVTGEPEILRVP